MEIILIIFFYILDKESIKGWVYYLVVMVFYVNFVWIINKIEVNIGNIGLNILKF